MKFRIAVALTAVAALTMTTGCMDDTSCSVLDNGDGTVSMSCPDGSSGVLVSPEGLPTNDAPIVEQPVDDDPVVPVETPVDQPVDPQDEPPGMIMPGDLNASDLARIDNLRTAIGQGLDVGQGSFLEQVSVTLQGEGIVADYESTVDEAWSAANQEIEACPFVKYQGNVVPTGATCDYLVDIAKVETYAELNQILAESPLPEEIALGEDAEEADFWYEQGAVSGIEQHRVLVRSDIKDKQLCNTQPTVKESSYDKGVTIGAQMMADAFNEWLAQNGHVADYPTMSKPIQVCNVNDSLLDPAFQAAKKAAQTADLDKPLCDGYEPPTPQLALDYSQAEIDYKQGIIDGIDDERSLAAVRIFKIVPCNVGDPLVIDLDGDGLELLPVHRGVNFDFYGTGRTQAVSWVQADDGLLALDRNGNGTIDDGTELFGNVDLAYGDGFAQLAELDTNLDGAVTAADDQFAQIVVWRDLDADGETDAGELSTLADHGVESLPVIGAEVTMRSAGTRITMAAEASSASGPMLVGDAMFTTAPFASPRLAR